MSVQANTENVILLRENSKIIGFIHRAVAHGSAPMSSEEMAQLIDPQFGMINRNAMEI